jgi:hypothetical protein
MRTFRLAFAAGLAAAAVIPGCHSQAAAPLSAKPAAMSIDYETNDFKQWSRRFRKFRPDDAAIVESPVRQGRYAAKFVVHPGDTPVPGLHTERTEISSDQQQTAGFEGSEQWYGWSVYFPDDFNPSPDTWNVFTQFHATAGPCPRLSPNIAFGVRVHGKAQIQFEALSDSPGFPCQYKNKNARYIADVQANHWYDFVLHVKWSDDPAQGFYEVWLDGKKVVDFTRAPTLYQGYGTYMTQGLYRGPSPLTSTLYIDALKRGDSYDDVSPPPRPAAGKK